MCQMIHSLEFENQIQFRCRKTSGEVRYSLQGRKDTNEYEYYKEVNIYGTALKIGMFIVTDIQQSEKEFGEIREIIKIKDELVFYVTIYEEITFDHHYHAYIVQYNSNKCKLIKYKDLPIIAPSLSVRQNNIHFLALRYGL